MATMTIKEALLNINNRLKKLEEALTSITGVRGSIEIKDKEIENIKQELGKKDQEIIDLKVVKAKVETANEKPSLTVGSVDSTSDDSLVEIRRKVDNKAFGHNSLGAK